MPFIFGGVLFRLCRNTHTLTPLLAQGQYAPSHAAIDPRPIRGMVHALFGGIGVDGHIFNTKGSAIRGLCTKTGDAEGEAFGVFRY